jgi:hypothetical protein
MRGIGAYSLTTASHPDPTGMRCGDGRTAIKESNGSIWCYSDAELAALRAAGAGVTVRNATPFERFTHSLTEVPWWVYAGIGAGGLWFLLGRKH